MVTMARTSSATLPALDQLDACLYCRISKADRRQKRSVPQQEAEGRAVAKQNDWHLPDSAVFVETKAISASRHNPKAEDRPKYIETIDYLRTHKPKVLILWEVSRYTRKLSGGVDLLDMCRELGILIHVVSLYRTFDVTEQYQREALVHEFLAAERESEQISKRTRRDAAHAAVAGKPNGMTPYGYERFYASTRELLRQVPKPGQAEVVVEAFERFRMSENLSAIIKDFNSRGILSPTGKQWTIVMLRRILRNPAYMGMRSHLGTLHKAMWPAIVSEEVWHDCNNRLDDPARRTNTAGTEPRHLLTSIMTCSVCDAAVKAHLNNGHRVYSCRAKHCASVPLTEAEKFVNEEVRQRLISVRLDPDPNREAEREAILDQVAELQQRMDEIEDNISTAAKSAVAMLTRTYERLAEERDKLLATSATVRKSPVVGLLISNPEKWDDLTHTQKRAFLTSGRLVDAIEVIPVGKGFTRPPISERVSITWVEQRLSSNPQG